MRVYIFVIFLFCFSQMFSQDPSNLWVGFTGSPDLVTAKYFDSPSGFGPNTNPYGDGFNKQKRIGGSFGFFVSRTIKKRLSLQIGLQYFTNGDRIKSDTASQAPVNGLVVIGEGFETHYHWLAVPLKVNYSFVVTPKIQLYATAAIEPTFYLRESKVTEFYFDNGGKDRNNVPEKFGPIQIRPSIMVAPGLRMKLSYRWIATIEPFFRGTLHWSDKLTYSSQLNSFGVSLGIWKGI